MRGAHSKVGGKESGRPHLGHEAVGRLAVLVSPDGFSWDFGGRFFLQTESTQDGWRQHYVGNHVVRLLHHYLARRYDLVTSTWIRQYRHDGLDGQARRRRRSK